MSDLERLIARQADEYRKACDPSYPNVKEFKYGYQLACKHAKELRELERAEREQVEQEEPRVPEYEGAKEVPE